ncbi:NYN domain protein [archaeon BMS3Bbin15]|nr:NYN domain protein [archaeon BMS3Bbin15]
MIGIKSPVWFYICGAILGLYKLFLRDVVFEGGITVDYGKDAIVFIDGNNFYHNIKKMSINPSSIDFFKLCEFVCLEFECNRKKTIYYNSIPHINDGKKVYWSHIKFLENLKKLPKFEVKTRKLQKNSTKEILEERQHIISKLDLCELCKPKAEENCNFCVGNIKTKEKGIDVMIATEMLEKSIIRKECDCCILISGDADFIPALDIIKSNGTDVFSASLPSGYSSELRKKHNYLVLKKGLILDECLRD